MILRLFLFFIFSASSLSVFAETNEDLCLQNSSTIDQKLNCLTGVQVTKLGTEVGVQMYQLQFEQLIDHDDPSLGTFSQKLGLIHRGDKEPMVLQTSGYSIFGIRDSALSRLFATNQLQIEHRFFSTSRPQVLDWSKLNVKQSADDFHAITTKFKKIYAGNWVNTGASKGGMTSTYHRFFYPDDLNGTVADVAPLSFSRSDQRYNDFVNSVGGDTYSQCRNDWKQLQIDLLKNRDSLTPEFKGDFSFLGSADIAFEHAVIEAVFYFWQYANPDNRNSGCPALAAATTLDQKFAFLKKHAPADYYDNSNIEQFLAYYYQSATQLGGPSNSTSHIETLRRFEFDVAQYTPKGEALPYTNDLMRQVDTWVKTDASNILFVYGELDPWSAAAYETGSNAKVIKLYAPKGNHGVNFTALVGSDKNQALSAISAWLGKTPVGQIDLLNTSESFGTLDELEFQMRKQIGLRH